MIILWLMVIIFGVMSIMFLLGKGSFLIAGYNTASPEQKEQYDEKKLCRVMGISTLIITLSLLAAVYFEEQAAIIVTVGIIVSIVLMFVGTNILSRKQGSQQNRNYTKTSWYKQKSIWSTILGGVLLLGVGYIMFMGKVDVQFYDDYFHVGASMTTGMDIHYADIENIDYQTDINLGRRTFGVGSTRLQAGNFKNDEYGSYKLYSYTGCKEYIVIKTNENYVVINDKNEEKTKELYHQILADFKD